MAAADNATTTRATLQERLEETRSARAQAIEQSGTAMDAATAFGDEQSTSGAPGQRRTGVGAQVKRTVQIVEVDEDSFE